MEPRLPHDVLYRPKMGFAVPLARWFRGPLRERVRGSLLGERIRGSGVFDMAFVERVVDEHDRGLRDWSALIWSLQMFDGFLAREQQAAAPTADTAAARVAG